MLRTPRLIRASGLPASCLAACLLAASALPAAAGNPGRSAPPPLVLSPNLTQPWLLQLREAPKTRGLSRDSGWHMAARTPQPQAQVPGQSPQREIPPQFLPTIVSYQGTEKPGTIVIDTNERYLYLVQADGTARRYGVGVGKPGFEWAGTHKVTRKAEWPDWRPPAEMRARRPDLPTFMEGGPANPLGARALYLGSTLYRIHGSNQPWTIGQAVSSGCIRMRNEDVTDLYERVGVGTTVRVI